MITIEEAAHNRAQGIRARADRPSQRRAFDGAPVGFTRGLSADTELRASSKAEGSLHFTGRATVYEREYEMWDMFGPYGEIVTTGAGTNSLNRADLSVPLVLDHAPLRRIAITGSTESPLSLSEDDEALNVDAPSLSPLDHDVAYIQQKFASDLKLEMSFRFRIMRGSWNDDYTQYRIDEYDLHRGDVAIVGYGANPFTDGDMRAADPVGVAERFRGADVIPEHVVVHRR